MNDQNINLIDTLAEVFGPAHEVADGITSFGPVIYSYTRKQAIADGVQHDVSKVADEAGIKFPVFITAAVWANYVTVPAGVSCQDEAGRLWDVVHMLRYAIQRTHPGQNCIPVAFYVRNDNRAPKLVKVKATCGPVDIDDPRPSITVMMPDED